METGLCSGEEPCIDVPNGLEGVVSMRLEVVCAWRGSVVLRCLDIEANANGDDDGDDDDELIPSLLSLSILAMSLSASGNARDMRGETRDRSNETRSLTTGMGF